MIRLLLALLLFLPVSVQAGTFCLAATGLAPQCLYEDVATCQRAINSQTQGCIVNPDAVLHLTGAQPYCVVNSQRVGLCIYNDRNACYSAAGRSGALCVEQTLANEANPFRYDQRLQN